MVVTSRHADIIIIGARDATNAAAQFIAVSDDDNEPTESDVNLGGVELREAVFDSRTDTTSVSKTLFLDGTEYNGNTVKKAGLYEDASGDTLLTAGLTNEIVKDSNTEIFVEIKQNYEVVNV